MKNNVDEKLATLEYQKDVLEKTIKFLVRRSVDLTTRRDISLSEFKDNFQQCKTVDSEIESSQKRLEDIDAQIMQYKY